jgi:hypothetical protein
MIRGYEDTKVEMEDEMTHHKISVNSLPIIRPNTPTLPIIGNILNTGIEQDFYLPSLESPSEVFPEFDGVGGVGEMFFGVDEEYLFVLLAGGKDGR